MAVTNEAEGGPVLRALAVLLSLGLLLGACAEPLSSGAAGPRDRSSRSGQPSVDGGGQGAGGSGPAGSSSVRSLARGPISTGWIVTRVVDGDTVELTSGARIVTVRLIGIDTPETVHPTEPIECYGPQATGFANRRLLGAPAVLEFDPSQGRRDYYGRTLAYVWRVRGADSMFNLEAVRRGYALEYTYDDAYAWQPEMRRAQQHARDHSRGVWRCPRPGD